MTRTLTAVALLLAATAATPALADGPVKPRAAAAETASFEADRRDILAMAGDYKVRFDMRETTPWQADYTPIPDHVAGGHEAVRVIEDTGRVIRLQHLLVVDAGGKPMVIKHWRQDWEYEPARVLVYTDRDTWTWEAVPAAMRAGRWSQTVYQVDDSPRYGGWGQWTTEGGVRRWRSNWTWRPLARRDAVRGPVYDRYLGINRHQPTPTGWIHWQDNTKMGDKDSKLVPFVQESVLNTYTRDGGFNVKAADDYWAATKGYWAAIRAEWTRIADAKGGIRITEEADHGTVISGRVLEIADEIQQGKTSEAKAIATAKALIDQGTRAAN
ncbi:DUF6607 family protein [Sphingomonas sp.]|uniref:DUF6607 family protein n=1 Tax=Sphingomonas sp. TaxID=28214 RepID=UPI002D13167F|nr:DUF6607 family protein [Sphingomonas sp.]HWK35202.1 DUF6607 family protein [Sphingomonas sp.]